MADFPSYRDPEADRERGSHDLNEPPTAPRWVKVFGIIALLVVIVFVVLLFARGPGAHGPGRHLSCSGRMLPSGVNEGRRLGGGLS